MDSEVDFKTETECAIKGRKVKQYKLVSLYRGREVFQGEGEIDWNKIPKSLLKYDAGYGIQYWGGWITFENEDSWIERMEYDGSEWWSQITPPKLESPSKDMSKDTVKEIIKKSQNYVKKSKNRDDLWI